MLRAESVPNVNALLRQGILYNPVEGYVSPVDSQLTPLKTLLKKRKVVKAPLTLKQWAKRVTPKPWTKQVSGSSGKPYEFIKFADESADATLTFKDQITWKHGADAYVAPDGMEYWLQRDGIGRRLHINAIVK